MNQTPTSIYAKSRVALLARHGKKVRIGMELSELLLGLEVVGISQGKANFTYLLTDNRITAAAAAIPDFRLFRWVPRDYVCDLRYLSYDIRGVADVARNGTTTFCMTLDPHIAQYHSRIFGRKNYTMLDHIE